MGRPEPTVVLRPNQNRRDERARRARDMKNRDIPDMLRASPRARHGIHKADLIVDPASYRETPQNAPSNFPTPEVKIRVQCADTLSAAAKMSERPFATRRAMPAVKSRQHKPNVTVLNMASQLKPGGGFLDGANSQEEFICARTTLYPSLWDSFYRLPEISGVYTPDVLVFRDHLPEANPLAKRDRYFVDVISSGMLRFADAKGEGCSCGVSYCDKHRDLVARKMKAVLRIAQMKGAERLVLGAWGCGAYGNPVREIAKLWRKVVAGGPRQRRPNLERWDGIKEIVFAIPDRLMLREFENVFSDVLAPEEPQPFDTDGIGRVQSDESGEISELLSKIAETEMQMEQVQNPRSRARLREVLAVLQRELAQGLAAKASRDEDLTQQEDEEDEGFVTSGFAGSDGEDNSFYNFDENDVASDSSECTLPEAYEFRAQQQPSFDRLASEEDDSVDDVSTYPALAPSPRFDPQTGWFAGSMDQLSALLRAGGGAQRKISHTSPTSPALRPDSSGLEIDEMTLKDYLAKYEGTDVADG